MGKITLSTSGTLGDTFINVCKLYEMSKRNDITVNHYTIHDGWRELISDIYSLINVRVNFVGERDLVNPRVYSHLAQDDGIKPTPFPVFCLPKMPMPRKYIVINERSGKSYEHDRIIPQGVVHQICEEHKQPVVLIGTSVSTKHDHPFVFDMTDQTTLLEAFSIIHGAEEFYGFQGVLGFFALSQRIKTTLYCRNDADMRSVEIRVMPDWRLYIKDVIVA